MQPGIVAVHATSMPKEQGVCPKHMCIRQINVLLKALGESLKT